MKNLTQLIAVVFLLIVPMIPKSQIINTIAGNGIQGFSGDGGPATDSELYGPSGVCLDKAGNIYIADAENNRIRIINSAGVINTIAGNGYGAPGFGGYSGDGGQATNAELGNPQGVCIDKSGNIFITEERNERIRKVNTSGIITTIAGNGVVGHSGNGGMATTAELAGPLKSWPDTFGNLYIGDGANAMIRKVNTSGKITTIAGGGGQNPGDGGPATAADLAGDVYGITGNYSGDIYIAVQSGRVRKVDASGIIYTVAGNGVNGFYGDGGPATDAELYNPTTVSVDVFNNIIISDVTNYRIRAVDASGIISTIIGNGVAGFSGDGGPALDAEIYIVDDLFEDKGNLYLADVGNNRIRKVSGLNILTSIPIIYNYILNIYPNPVNQTLYIYINEQINGGLATLSVIDITGREIMSFVKNTNTPLQIDISSLAAGMYLLSLKTKDTYNVQKFIKS